jgi:hypothetical protein
MVRDKNHWYAIIEGKMGSDNYKVKNVTYSTYDEALKLLESYEKDEVNTGIRFNLFQWRVV